jgi:hypothetical protein
MMGQVKLNELEKGDFVKLKITLVSGYSIESGKNVVVSKTITILFFGCVCYRSILYLTSSCFSFLWISSFYQSFYWPSG